VDEYVPLLPGTYFLKRVLKIDANGLQLPNRYLNHLHLALHYAVFLYRYFIALNPDYQFIVTRFQIPPRAFQRPVHTPLFHLYLKIQVAVEHPISIF
jgi:hypothetical protein